MDLPLGNEGALNGATAVTILAAPASGKQRQVPRYGVSVYNADSVAHTYTFQKNKNGTARILDIQATIAAGAVCRLDVIVVLDATDESLEAKYEAPKTTTESVFNVAAMECS